MRTVKIWKKNWIELIKLEKYDRFILSMSDYSLEIVHFVLVFLLVELKVKSFWILSLKFLTYLYNLAIDRTQRCMDDPLLSRFYWLSISNSLLLLL